MATHTTNFNLTKPDANDLFELFRQWYNANLDIIDANLGGGASTLAGLSDVNLTSPVTNDSLIYDGAEWVNSPLSAVAFSGDYSDLSNAPTIPTKTSDLNNDSDFVSDASYVHTDNNFTNADVTKLSGIQAGAEVNVQSDWNEADNTADDYIKNKPTIPTKTSDLNNDSGFLDSSDITVTQVQTTGTKIATIDVDGNSTDLYAPTGGSGGHTIVNESGTALADEPNLQFTDGLKASDDSGNNKTKVGVNTTFTEASTRANINSGDTFSTILGKIKKWFSDIPNLFVSKSGDTMSGNLSIDRQDGSVSYVGYSVLQVGNNIPMLSDKNSRGLIEIYGDKSDFTRLRSTCTAMRVIDFPDKDGTVALTSDIPDISTKVSKSGDTMSGRLTIDQQSGNSGLWLGNNIAQGNTGASRGLLLLYGLNQYYGQIFDGIGLTGNRSYLLPDASGTIALKEDITFGLLLSKNWNYSAFSVTLDSSSAIILFGARNGKAVFSIFPPYSSERYDIKNDFGITFTHSISGNTHTIGLSAPTSTVGSGCYLYFLGSPV